MSRKPPVMSQGIRTPITQNPKKFSIRNRPKTFSKNQIQNSIRKFIATRSISAQNQNTDPYDFLEPEKLD